MSRLPVAGLVTAALLFAADQLGKYVVTGPLGIDYLGASKTLLPIFDLRFVPNQGISLGLLHADSSTARWLLVLLTAGIAVVVSVWMARERNRADQIGLGLVLGGALGNILDRVRLGYVVDLLDLHFGEWRPFLVFNLADTAITMGVLVLLVRALLTRDAPRRGTASVENGNA